MSLGRVLSVNVGLPRVVDWQGQAVRTAIWKAPVDGRVMARRLNLDGDEQADKVGHGGEHRAVFVYQVDSYRYWERQLGRDDFVRGQFGENLTVSGLADDQVCVGDRYEIGEALFEVTQPRVTCYRLGIRMDNSQMPSLVVAHKRPGFYMRVLREGVVGAGDEIAKIAAGPERMTVAEIDALLYLPGRAPENLVRALRIPALSPGWKGSFAELLDQHAETAPSPAWAGFRPLRVVAIEPESSVVTSFRLEAADGDPLADPVAGQHLTVRVRPQGATSPLLRSYSLSDTRGLRISVKREGAVSRYLHDELALGDMLDAAAPRGAFALRPGEGPVVLLSAGVGATPVLTMLRALAETGSSRSVWWIHGARNQDEHAFAGEVDSLLVHLADAHRLIAYSAPGVGGDSYDVAGRITGAVLEEAGVPAAADYYVCGPPAFMREVGAALADRGVTPDQIRTEIFGALPSLRPGVVAPGARRPHPPEGVPGVGPRVAFARSDLTVRWDPRFASLLELAEASDVPVMFGCRTGVCHSCATGLLSGEVAYDPQPLEPPSADSVLVCCSRPRGELVVDL